MTIKLRAYNPVYVELGDKKYESVDMPYEASKRFADIMQQMSEIGDDKEDEAKGIKLLLEGFDMVLQPHDGHKTKASTVLDKGLKDGDITPRQFIGLWEDILTAIQEVNGTEEVEGEIDRPT